MVNVKYIMNSKDVRCTKVGKSGIDVALINDVPENCFRCPRSSFLHEDSRSMCCSLEMKVLLEDDIVQNGRPVWCPLT